MIEATFQKHILYFKFDAGTSRGVLKERACWYILVSDPNCPGIIGIGECGPLKGLSLDDVPDFEQQLERICHEHLFEDLNHPIFIAFPSIRFGFETALLDLKNGGQKGIFQNDFYFGKSNLPINGLVWMGDKQFMMSQIEEKLEQGFTCLKMKVGALDFETEKAVLASIRSKYSAKEITIRLDANGAFNTYEALTKLQELSRFDIHSIEQPLQSGQYTEMAALCQESPIPIALDEELIPIGSFLEKKTVLQIIRPHYIILKPGLLGGFAACDEWINLAEQMGLGWWITSALESNVGLNAICQYTFEKLKDKKVKPMQGLGTGSLYTNNIPSPLFISEGHVAYNPVQKWMDLSALF